ncbi:hypothetical protein [Nonomuraea sp. NPDC050202]|uniref:hypothetical protein n=1 Tax=Nonomuraea sp. NPDC050202 TaxID=3155035 RepID=UPI0033C0160E
MTSGHHAPEDLAAMLADAIARMDENVEQQAQKLASARASAARAQRAHDADHAVAGTEEEWMAYNSEMARRILLQMEELGELWRRRFIHDCAGPEDAVRLATIPSPEWTATIASLLAGIARLRVKGKMNQVHVRIR